MPILCEPGATFDVTLEGDKLKSNPPTFVCAAQSIRGQQRICATIDKLVDDTTTTADLFAETLQRLGEVVVGWKNMPQPFSPEAMADLLNYSECRELLRGVLYHSQLSADQKKV